MNLGKRKTVAIWCGLSENQIKTKVHPICKSELVGRIVLFRRFPTLPYPKIESRTPPRLLRRSNLLSQIWILAVTVKTALYSRFSLSGSFDFAFGITAFPHGFYARLAGALAGKSVGIWWIGTDIAKQLKNRLIKPIYKLALKNVALTLVMGRSSRERLETLGWPRDRIFFLMNAHDIERFRPENTKKSWDIINVGRHDRFHKRLHILLEAVSIVRKKVPDVSCALVGDGPDRRYFEKVCSDMGLNGNVSFLGTRIDVPVLLNKSKLFVMCSAWEGLPASIVEAFCCGVPVVTNDVDDIKEVARDGVNSIIVKSDTPIGYAEAILSFLRDEMLREQLHQGALETRQKLCDFNPTQKLSKFWDDVFENIPDFESNLDKAKYELNHD